MLIDEADNAGSIHTRTDQSGNRGRDQQIDGLRPIIRWDVLLARQEIDNQQLATNQTRTEALSQQLGNLPFLCDEIERTGTVAAHLRRASETRSSRTYSISRENLTSVH